MFSEYICALDIGSNKISASLARIKNKRITHLFFESVVSKGVKRGAIVDSVELTKCISVLLKNLRSKSGMNIKVIYANISGQDVITKHSCAILPLAERGNKVITLSDINRVNEQARILGSSLEEEIIHQIPLSYSIDSKREIAYPLGLYSHQLEVDLYLICAKVSAVQSLTRVINQAGYELKKIFFSGIAMRKLVFGKNIKEGSNVICDIGSDITELVIFKEGVPKTVKMLPLGGDDLTFEISRSLEIPFDLAEEVKKAHSFVGDYSLIQEEKEILIKKDNSYRPIKQKLISEILTSKTKLICQIIQETIAKEIPCSQVNSFVATGGAALMEGFLETLESNLGIPVRFVRIVNPEINQVINNNEVAMSGQRFLTYISSLGVICEALAGDDYYVPKSVLPSRNIAIKAINRIKEIYQEYF